MRIGFSTGALALSDFHAGLAMNQAAGLNAVELSALRETEVVDLVASLDGLSLHGLEYVSFHAPSSLQWMSGQELVAQLQPVFHRGWPVIVHPDIIADFDLWAGLGDRILVENMDQRKPIGRNTKELRQVFSKLPDARFCFDIAHARQVDPTMSVAVEILLEFGDRLAELHISEVDSASRHVAISQMAIRSYQRISTLIPATTPVIIESMISQSEISYEVDAVRNSFGIPSMPPAEVA
jgi:hypothetical protein